MTDNRIKQCPFCGSDAFMDPTIIEPGWYTCMIMCNSCPAQIIGGGDTEEEAIENSIKLWNRRS